eukprot:scaffold68756_cov41-Phaeocystis_antarctica.AAC.2
MPGQVSTVSKLLDGAQGAQGRRCGRQTLLDRVATRLTSVGSLQQRAAGRTATHGGARRRGGQRAAARTVAGKLGQLRSKLIGSHGERVRHIVASPELEDGLEGLRLEEGGGESVRVDLVVVVVVVGAELRVKRVAVVRRTRSPRAVGPAARSDNVRE